MKSHRTTVPVLGIVSLVFAAAGLRPTAAAQQLGDDLADRVLDRELLQQLAIPAPARSILGQKPIARGKRPQAPGQVPLGIGTQLDPTGPLSAALMTAVGGRDTQFSDVALAADWDGREDGTADRSTTVDDFSTLEPDIDSTMTRVAISEHTRANGFTENVYYYGDSEGNLFVGIDSSGDALVDDVLRINLPTALNAFGTLLSDDQVVITGLAVNPVADLSSFPDVNGSYSAFTGQVGEILYVTYMDTVGLRLASNNVIVRGGLLAFPIADLISPATSLPGVQSTLGFPVTVGGAFGVAFSVFPTFGGLAVDDDGSVYFAQADLIQRTGGNIVKVTSVDSATSQDRSLATSGILTINTLNPVAGQYGTTSGPADQVNRFTNYSGTSTLFGNVVSLAAGSCNTLYAAVAKSNTSSGAVNEGLFPAPAAFGAAGTPSMVISFADCTGAFDACSGLPQYGIGGILPVGNGFADVAIPGAPLQAGVNNFRAYVLGNGPDLRSAAPAVNHVFGNTDQTLKVDLQIDFTVHSGLMLSEAEQLYVISGGTPAGIGLNPSPTSTEILSFGDCCPADRRGDYVDHRGDFVPNPPASGGTVGDGDSDRFDHIFLQAPVDGVTFTPTGLAGLARGFLLYLNRTRNDLLAQINLPNGVAQGDDATSGPIVFEDFDPSHDVAGGDDSTVPFSGDDSYAGGFEFGFGSPVPANCGRNEFFLNSNGNVSFDTGDTSNSPNVLDFRSGPARIAPAWSDLNTGARGSNLNTFPVQALGFADVNAFEVRWINVPEFGQEACGSSNTFSVTLFDDGTRLDENGLPQEEGPTDLVFEIEPTTGLIIGCPPRREGSGQFRFEYCRTDLLGTDLGPVLTGFSVGGLLATAPPGICEINLSEAARESDTGPFGVIQGVTASLIRCLIGEGTEPTLFEYFNEGRRASLDAGGKLHSAIPDFDLRAEGNDALACTPNGQPDLNRAHVGFLGTSCQPPANPECLEILPVLPVDVAPGQPTISPTSVTGIINAVCDADIYILGCGFYPNEVTTVCGGNPTQRPGKVVSTAVTLTCDSNCDGVPESVLALVNVRPLSDNLIQATLPTLPGFPGTPFSLACCGGPAIVTVTTTFTAGDNNQFGPFTRTTSCAVDLGVRAPVVLSVTPSSGDCSVAQDVLISGSCFSVPQGPVSRVYAVEFNPTTQTLNPANTIEATTFVVLSTNLIDALFDFSAGGAGKTFMVFVTGPGGTSRNLTQGQVPAGCVRGNEQGIQVTFTCQQAQPQNHAPVANCKNVTKTAGSNGTAAVSAAQVNNGSFDTDGDPISLNLSPAGPFPIGTTWVTLTVTDSHGASSSCSATVTVNGTLPKVKITSPDYTASEPGSNTGKLRVARSGSTATALTVFFTVSGSATSGSDYIALPASVTIPIGQAYVDVLVKAKDDNVKEPTETVVGTLTANAAYTLASPTQASVNILDND